MDSQFGVTVVELRTPLTTENHFQMSAIHNSLCLELARCSTEVLKNNRVSGHIINDSTSLRKFPFAQTLSLSKAHLSLRYRDNFMTRRRRYSSVRLAVDGNTTDPVWDVYWCDK